MAHPPETISAASPVARPHRIAWHCRIDPPLPGHVNMAVDRTLLERVEQAPTPMTWVRFYRWDRPTVSLGRNQRREVIDLNYCRQRSRPIVYRPTGGRAVFHDNELTYSVASNDPSAFPLNSLRRTYGTIARLLQEALSQIGIVTELAPSRGTDSGAAWRLQPGNKPPCFLATARYELLASGKKICGSAQRRLRRSFLQHGSLPITIDFSEMGRTLGVPPTLLESAISCISEQSPSPCDFAVLAHHLRHSFARYLRGEPAD